MRVTRSICSVVCAGALFLASAAPASALVWRGAVPKTGVKHSWSPSAVKSKTAAKIHALEATGPDAAEIDDTLAQAKPLTLGVQTGIHNFFPNPGQTEDEDWFKFDAVAGTTYDIVTQLEGASVDVGDQVPMELEDAAGNSIITNFYQDWWGDPTSRITWTAPTSATYYVVCWDAFDIYSNEGHAVEYSLNASSLGTVSAGNVGRIGGADRYAVAATLAENTSGDYAGVTNIVIASGLEKAMADALSASGLAGTVGGPVLLVRADRAYLPAPTKAAIQAIAAQNPGSAIQVHIVGGPASVPVALEKQIRLAAPGHTVTIQRISGADRYAVSANVAADIRKRLGAGNYLDTAFVVNGQNASYFSDALACSPAAAGLQAPILLVKSTVIPPATAAALKFYPNRILVGIEGKAIYDSVYTSLGTASTDWVQGASREQIARNFAEYWEGLKTPSYQYVVTNKLTDALTAGCAPSLGYNFVLYVNADVDAWGYAPINTESLIEIRRAHSPVLTIVGGTASVSTNVETRLNELVGNYGL